MRRLLLILAAALAAAGCGSSTSGDRTAPPSTVARATATARPAAEPVRHPVLAAVLVRSSHPAHVDMDSNPANLASAVITYAFGKLPDYIDEGNRRLLPFDMFRAATPGVTVHRTYAATLPRTSAVLDAAVVSGTSRHEVRAAAARYRIQVSLDGRWLAHPERYWVFYRNDGPQICRIYFPDDLSSLQMGANSVVLKPLSAGRHLLHVEVEQTVVPGTRPARFVTDYRLRVLARGPGPRERAIAPEEDSAPPADRTPLAFSHAQPLQH